MKTVYKYPFNFDDIIKLKLPYGSEILTVQEQNGVLCLWALVDDEVSESEFKTYTLRMVGTDHPIEYDNSRYINTVQTAGGKLVWHFFDITD